jgi:hypothetical protein
MQKFESDLPSMNKTKLQGFHATNTSILKHSLTAMATSQKRNDNSSAVEGV